MRISAKLSLGTFLTLALVGAATVFLQSRIVVSNAVGEMRSAGRMAGALIEESLRHSMLRRDVGIINRALRNMRQVGPINSILLVDEQGSVNMGTDAGALGTVISLPGAASGDASPEDRQGVFRRGEGVYRWVQMVRNHPECHRCHQAGRQHNGAIIIDFSTARMEQSIRGLAVREVLVLLGAFLGAGTVLIFLTRSVVTRRLHGVAGAVEAFRDGNLAARLPVAGSDEIAALSARFNEMAETIESYRRKLDEQVRTVERANREWQATFDCITDPVTIHDREFRIVRANRAAADHFGLRRSAVVDRKCHELFHGTCFPVNGCPHRASLEEERPVFTEVDDPRSGKLFQVSAFPYYSPSGERIGSVHIARDVTEVRRNERRLIVSERLASLGQMAAGIAHEINNPLAAMNGCVEAILAKVHQGVYDEDFCRRYLSVIQEEIFRCKGITTNMLSFVRRESDEKHDLDLNLVARKALELVRIQGRLRRVEVVEKYERDLPWVYGSEGELRQALLVFIVNALDAMSDAGILTVQTRSSGGSVEVSVGDTGPGIPVEHRDRIFEPFFSTKHDNGGTGLGLSIAAKLAANHDGAITFESGNGTTVTLTLPIR